MADVSQNDDPFHRDPVTRKVIIFNGPPGAGKDFASDAVRSYIQINAPWMKPTHIKFSEPLKRAAHALYAAFHSWDYYDSKDGRPQKGASNGDFLGLSPREAYIEMFNKLAELHDSRALGFIMRKRMVRSNFNSVFVMSDGGRVDDLRPVIDLVGERNVLIIEIHTVGANWDGDNRTYIGNNVLADYPNVTVMKLPNTIGDREDRDIFRMLCQGAVKKFLNIEEKV